MPFAAGAVVVPVLAPGEVAELVVPLDRRMNGKYDVSVLKTAALLRLNATVDVIAQTPTSVTLRLMVAQGLAGAGTVFVICN